MVRTTSEVETQPAEGEQKTDEFWLDYVADTGDGQMPTYNILCRTSSPIIQATTALGLRLRQLILVLSPVRCRGSTDKTIGLG